MNNFIAVAASIIGADMLDQPAKKKHRTVLLHHNNGDPIVAQTIPRRNDLCPCKSGKKFKNCHIGVTVLKARPEIEVINE